MANESHSFYTPKKSSDSFHQIMHMSYTRDLQWNSTMTWGLGLPQRPAPVWPPGRGWRVSHLHWTSSRITAWARVGPQVRNLGGSGLPLYILLVTCDRGNADLLLHGDRIPIFELEISLTWCNYPYQKKFSFELWMDRSYNPQCFDILSRSQFDVAGRGCAK